jgi:hypothetical protein
MPVSTGYSRPKKLSSQERKSGYNWGMATASVSPTDSDIFAAVIAPDRPGFSPEAARSLLNLQFTREQQARIHELLDKSGAGTLDPDEQTELDVYGRVGNFLSFVHAKARLTLQDTVQKK